MSRLIQSLGLVTVAWGLLLGAATNAEIVEHELTIGYGTVDFTGKPVEVASPRNQYQPLSSGLCRGGRA